MLVVGEKIPLVGLILKQNFRKCYLLYKEGSIFLCEDLIGEREGRI